MGQQGRSEEDQGVACGFLAKETIRHLATVGRFQVESDKKASKNIVPKYINSLL